MAEPAAAPSPASPNPETVPPCTCPNCGSAAGGRFCAACGQDLEHDLRRPIRRFAAELIEETLSLDGQLLRTVPALLFRPGRLAAEIAAGRRVRYTSPLRLYLGASVALFLALAAGGDALRFRLESGGPELLSSGQGPGAPGDAVRRLRAGGVIRAFAAARLERLAASPPGEAERRVAEAFVQNAPRALFLLVPVLALLLKAVHPRRFYAEHLVLALHAQSVAFLAMVPSALLGWRGLQVASLAAAAVWGLLALRRVYGRGWVPTALAFLGIGAAYGAMLAVVISVAALVSLAEM